MSTHPNTGQELITRGQADGYEIVNRLTYQNAALLHGVNGRQTAPPGSPADGDIYIVDGTGTGVWTSHDDEVATYSNGAWYYWTPGEGTNLYVQDENVRVEYDGSSWGCKGRIITLPFAAAMSTDTTSTQRVMFGGGNDAYGEMGTDLYPFCMPISGRIHSASITALHADGTSPPSTWTMTIEPYAGGTDWFAETFDLDAAVVTPETTLMVNSLTPAQDFAAGDEMRCVLSGASLNILIAFGSVVLEEIL